MNRDEAKRIFRNCLRELQMELIAVSERQIEEVAETPRRVAQLVKSHSLILDRCRAALTGESPSEQGDSQEAPRNGLWRIYWTEEEGGGSSVAAIGRFADGSCWIAPTNWINPDLAPLHEQLTSIARMELIATQDSQ